MANPKSPSIYITKAQQEILENISRRSTADYREVQRAKIILVLAQNSLSNAQAANKLKTSASITVRKWRYRWLSYEDVFADIENAGKESWKKDLENKIKESLKDIQRPGSPSTFTPEQYCQILKVSLEDPGDSNRPVTHWSSRELADEVIKRGIVKSISSTQIKRFLKRSRY